MDLQVNHFYIRIIILLTLLFPALRKGGNRKPHAKAEDLKIHYNIGIGTYGATLLPITTG